MAYKLSKKTKEKGQFLLETYVDDGTRTEGTKYDKARAILGTNELFDSEKEYEFSDKNGNVIGVVSHDAKEAIEKNKLDSYKPKNDEEKRVIDSLVGESQNKKEKKTNNNSVFKRYNINPDKFEFSDFLKWADEHNYKTKDLNSPDAVNYSPTNYSITPKYEGGFLGIGGKKMTTEQEDKDMEFLRKFVTKKTDNPSNKVIDATLYTAKELVKNPVKTGAYLIDKASAGATGVLENTIKVVEAVPDWTIGKIARLVGADNVANRLEKNVQDVWNRETYAEQQSKKADERTDDEKIKFVGNIVENAGALVPAIATEVATAGMSPALDTQVASLVGGKTFKALSKVTNTKAGKILSDMTKPSQLVFQSGVFGSSASNAYRETGDVDKAMAYGALTAIAEGFTEQLFGGFAGTDMGSSLIDFPITNNTARKVVNLFTEGAEEIIMSYGDTGIKRITGVDKNAALPTAKEVIESGVSGVLLSGLMSAATYPVNKGQTKKLANSLNVITNALNTEISDEKLKFVPLNQNASEKEIITRQGEIENFAKAYADALGGILINKENGTVSTSNAGKNLESLKDEVIKTGLESPKDSQAYKNAKTLSKKKNISDFDLGEQYFLNVEQTNKESEQKFKVKYAPKNASKNVKTFERTLAEKGVSDIDMKNIVSSAANLENSLSAMPKSGMTLDKVIGANQILTKTITNSVENKLPKTSGINTNKITEAEYWQIYSKNIDMLSAKDKTIDEKFVNIYTKIYSDALASRNSMEYNSLLQNTGDVAKTLKNYVLTGTVPGSLAGTNIVEKAGENLKDIISSAVGSVASAHSYIYGQNTPLAQQEESIRKGDFSSVKSEDVNQASNVSLAMLNTFKPGAMERIAEIMEKETGNFNIERFSAKLTEYYQKNGNINPFREFFTDGGIAVTRAMEGITEETFEETEVATEESAPIEQTENVDKYKPKNDDGVDVSILDEDVSDAEVKEKTTTTEKPTVNKAEEVKKGFGEKGKEAYEKVLRIEQNLHSPLSEYELLREFEKSYKDGFQERKSTRQSKLSEQSVKEAEKAGKEDRKNKSTAKTNVSKKTEERVWQTKKATESKEQGMSNKIVSTIRETIRPEVVSNSRLMKKLEDKFDKNGIEAIAEEILLRYKNTNSIGNFEQLFDDGGKAVYKILEGQQKSKTDTENKEPKPKKTIDNKELIEVQGIGTIKRSSLHPRQQKAIVFMEGFAKAANMKLVFVANSPDFDGAYDILNDTMRLDIYAGVDPMNKLSDIIIPTASHELTHWMHYQAPVLWNKLSGAVFSALEEVDGINRADRINSEIKRLKGKGLGHNELVAEDEIVARACEDMLAQSEMGKKVFETLSETEQKTITGKIKSIIQALKDWISDFLSSYKPSNRIEAEKIRQAQDKVDEILKLWNEGIEKSVEVSRADTKAEAFIGNYVYEQYGVEFDVDQNADEMLLSEKDNKITVDDVKNIQSIGRKSVNDFTSEDISKTKKIARKYFEEMGVKSPFFRAWFGDWRAKDKTPLHIVTEKGAKRKTTKNKDTNWDIQISGKVFNETTSQNSAKVKKAVPYLDYIEGIVSNAVLLDTYTIPQEKAKSENSAMMHSLYAVVDDGKDKEVIKLLVEELNDVNSDGTILRSYQLQDITNIPTASVRVQNNLSSLTNTVGNVKSISDLFKVVKQNDKNFNPKSASKVVNEDGTPKVVYHQTSEDISVFDTKHEGAGTSDGETPFGIFMKPTLDDIGLKGKKQIPLYAEIVNPLDVQNREELVEKAKKLSSEYEKVYEERKKLDNEYRKKVDDIGKKISVYMVEWRRKNPDASRTALYDDVRYVELSDSEDTIIETWENSGKELDRKMKIVLTEVLVDAGYDGVHLLKDEGSFGRTTETWIAFDSNQVKSATDNIGTFDKNNPDIRYSEKDTVPAKKTVKKTVKKTSEQIYREQNKALMQYIKDEYNKSEKFTPRIEDVRKAANRLGKGYIGDKKLAQEIGRIYKDVKSAIAYAEKPGVTEQDIQAKWNVVQEEVDDLAMDIVMNHQEKNDANWQMIKDLRDYMRGRTIKVPAENKGDFDAQGGLEELRKHNMGRFYISQTKGESMEALYPELRGMFGNLLPDISNLSDQLIALSDLYDEMAVTFDNPYDADIEAAQQSMSLEIMADMLVNIKEVKDTKDQRIEAVNKIIETEREKRYNALKRVKDRQDRKIREAKAKAKEKAEKRVDATARQRLLAVAKRLDSLSKKSKPEQQAEIQKLIGHLDLAAVSITKRNIDKLENIKSVYEEMKLNPDFVEDKHIERLIARLGKKQISDLDLQDVQTLTDVLLGIEHKIRTDGRDIDTADKRKISIQAEETMRNIDNSSGSAAMGIGKLADNLVSGVLTPTREARRITGYVDNDPLYIKMKSMQKGQVDMFDYQMKAEKMFEKFTNDTRFMESITGAKAKTKTYKVSEKNSKGEVIGKRNIELTPGMKISLLLHNINSSNQGHMKIGGVTIPNVKLYKAGKIDEAFARGEKIYLHPSDIRAITADLTPQERKYAKLVYKYYNEFAKNEVNRISVKLKGYEIAKVKDYFPIETNRDFSRQDFELVNVDGTIEGMGFLKERTQAKNPILLRDVASILEQSIRMNSKYVGLAIPVRNMSLLLGKSFSKYGEATIEEQAVYGLNYTIEEGYYGSVMDSIEKKWGVNGKEYINKIMQDMQGQKKDLNDIEKAVEKIGSRYVRGILSWNPKVAFNQVASIPSAIPEVGVKALSRSMFDFGRVNTDRIAEYTPLQYMRSKGAYDTTIADMTRAKKGPLAAIDKVVDKVDMMTWTDTIMTRKLWKAAIYNIKSSRKDLQEGSQEFYEAVAELYVDIMQNTQPNVSMMERPQFLRGGIVNRMLLAFKGEPFKNLNMLYEASANYKAKARQLKQIKNNEFATAEEIAEAENRLKQASKKFKVTVVSQMISTLLYGIEASIFQLLYGQVKDYWDDEEEKVTFESWLVGVLKNSVINTVTQLPWADQVVGLVTALTTDERYYSNFAPPFLASVENTCESLVKAHSKYQDLKSGEINWQEFSFAAHNAIGDVATFFGIPYENIVKNLKPIVKGAIKTSTKNEYIEDYVALKLDEALVQKSKNDKGKTVIKASSATYDILYKAMKNGDKEAYNAIVKDLAERGVQYSDIESKMKNKAKEDGNFDISKSLGFYAGVEEQPKSENFEKYLDGAEELGIDEDDLRAVVDFAESKKGYKERKKDAEEYIEKHDIDEAGKEFLMGIVADSYSVNDLNNDQYVKYAKTRATYQEKVQREVEGKDERDIAKIYNKISDFAEEYALSEASDGEYFMSAKWMNVAVDCESTLGMTTGKFIEGYVEYGTAIYSDKAMITHEVGYNVNDYLQFRELTKDLKSDKDSNGKDIEGQSKQDKIINVLNNMDVSNEVKAYLYSMEYKSNKNNPWASQIKVNYKEYTGSN